MARLISGEPASESGVCGSYLDDGWGLGLVSQALMYFRSLTFQWEKALARVTRQASG